MKAHDLRVSNLNISEDEYSYKGIFTLGLDLISMSVNLAEIDEKTILQEIVKKFSLSESLDEIRNIIMDKVIVQASISTNIKEGIDFQAVKRKKKIEKTATSLDMA